MQKALNIFEFFKSTLVINFAISFLILYFFGLLAFNYSFLTLGFLVSLLIKEVNAENEYLFYYNNAVSKIELWFYGSCFNFICLIIFNFILKLF